MGSGLKIEIIEPILKTALSLSFRDLLKKTLFDVELLITQNRLFAWSVFVSEQKLYDQVNQLLDK